MKTIRISTLWILIIMAVSSCLNRVQAQEMKGLPGDTDFHFYIANLSRVNDNQAEFDLLILNTNPARTFELGSVQAGILLDPSYLGKGLVTASIIPGTSTLNPSQVPGVITYQSKKNCIKIAPKSPPGIGSGSIISTDPENPSRLCRVRLSTSKTFLNGDSEIRFCLNGKPYPTKISRYVHETGLNTPLQVNSFTCFTQKDKESFTGSTKKSIASDEMIRIFPNPNNGNFMVGMESESEAIFEIQVRNELGTLIYQEENVDVKGKVNHSIRMKNAPDGTYTLILSRKGEILSRKFVVKQ